MSTPSTPVLMSAENPSGWKLEDLLLQLILEIGEKSQRIAGDKRSEAKLVRENNNTIVAHLAEAAAAQLHSMETLKVLGPDQGPRGTPRIGANLAEFTPQLTVRLQDGHRLHQYRTEKCPAGCDPALTVIRMKDGSFAARQGAKIYLGRLEVDVEKSEARVVFPFTMVDFTTEERIEADLNPKMQGHNVVPAVST